MAAGTGTRGMRMVGMDTNAKNPKIKPPEELSKKAKSIWRKIVNSVSPHHLQESDFVILSTYCEAYVLMMKASKMLHEQGEVITTSGGKHIKNPWFAIFQQSSQKVIAGSTKLRLAPSTRTKADRFHGEPIRPVPNTKLGQLINMERKP